MRPRLAYVTNPDSAHEDFDGPVLIEALDRARMDVVVQDWDVPAAWADFDAVLVGCAWGSTARRQEFLRWARTVDEETLLANPLRSLVRSTDRTYLRDLASHGFPCVPMLWFEPGDDAAILAEEVAATGWASLRVEPNTVTADARAVEADSVDTAVSAAADLLEAGCIVSVEGRPADEPERAQTAVVLVGGRAAYGFTHGDQATGARLITVDDDLAQLATRVVAYDSAGEEPVCARVDLVRGTDGWLLQDYNTCGPELMLQAHPAAAEDLAWAVKARIMPDERRSASLGR